MKGRDIQVLHQYYVKVSGTVVPVRVESLSGRVVQNQTGARFFDAWVCRNLRTGRLITVKSAQRFRGPVEVDYV